MFIFRQFSDTCYRFQFKFRSKGYLTSNLFLFDCVETWVISRKRYVLFIAVFLSYWPSSFLATCKQNYGVLLGKLRKLTRGSAQPRSGSLLALLGHISLNPIWSLILRGGSTSSLSHLWEPYGAACVPPMWFSILLSLALTSILTTIFWLLIRLEDSEILISI